MAGQGAGGNPINVINETAMHPRQWLVVVLMVVLNALDGFDVLSSAFAAPGITQEWSVERAALGVVLSAELVGMGFGSVLLGGAADKFGRKNLMLCCLTLMAAGMFLAGQAQNVASLVAFRFLTGIGIGGLLAATNAVVAESTNTKWRRAAIAAYVSGYPLGAIAGGLVASEWLLPEFGWRAIFTFGAVATAVLIPVIALLVPETAPYRASKGDLAGTNKTLAIFGKSQFEGLHVLGEDVAKPKVTDILSNPRLRRVTLLLAFGYMCHTITFYYIVKFAVQIVSDYPPGYPPPVAATVLTWVNVGGFFGSLIFGFVMSRLGVKWPTALVLLLSSFSVIWFGMGHDTIDGWQWAAILAGFATNASISGYYAAFARGFPAYARASGTGFVLGIGRLGAAGSPIIAGFLFEKVFGNDALFTVSAIMAMGSILSAILLLMLPEDEGDDVVAEKQPDRIMH